MIENETTVAGADTPKDIRASSHPLTSAIITATKKYTWTCKHIGTFSPIPSSNLYKSLQIISTQLLVII